MTHPLGRWTLALEKGGDQPEKSLIGGKAYSIAQMLALGLNTPPAVVITTEACAAYMEAGHFPDGLEDEMAAAIAYLERAAERGFAAGPRPLLVSVRSGAAISMPGMMDTVLNLGINDETEAALAAETGDLAFARDTHRRFYEMYAKTVMKAALADLSPDGEPAAWRRAVAQAAGREVPEDPQEQLRSTVQAVFDSWNSRRAKRYRKHHGIDDAMGTAVTIQMMAFGNLGQTSGTGVLFSRNPLDGAPEPYGQYLPNAQGEDVVSGDVTPEPLSAMAEAVPDAYQGLMTASRTLEEAHRDVQDIEFTVQRGTLYLLQCRAAKRAPRAAAAFAVAMANDGLIDSRTALSRITADQARALLQPTLAEGAVATATVIAQGEAACSGVGIGTMVTDTDDAERRAAAGEAVVLARQSTSPEDVHGMTVSRAVVTERGGGTSHAAVVCRALGVPCVVGCGENTLTPYAGQTVTVDGESGTIYAGELPVICPDEADDPTLATLTQWAAALSPVRAVRSEAEAGCDVLDLNEVEGAEDPTNLVRLLSGVTAAKGGALGSDVGVAAAVQAGVQVIVADHILPVLLAAVAGAAETA